MGMVVADNHRPQDYLAFLANVKWVIDDTKDVPNSPSSVTMRTETFDRDEGALQEIFQEYLDIPSPNTQGNVNQERQVEAGQIEEVGSTGNDALSPQTLQETNGAAAHHQIQSSVSAIDGQGWTHGRVNTTHIELAEVIMETQDAVTTASPNSPLTPPSQKLVIVD